MNMIKKYSPAFYLALIFGISLYHCTNLTLGDHLAADFPPEVSECTFFGDLNQPDQMVRSSREGEPWVICIREQLSLIGTDPYPLTDNYILAEDLDLAGEELPPMGDGSNSFTGTFDGNGRSITNFQIPAEADAIIGYLPLGSYDENAVFTNMPGAMTPQEVCDRSSPRPASTAPVRFNPHEEGGGNRLICQADQLTDTNAYIRTTEGLGEKYLLGRDVTLSGAFTPIGTSAAPFQGVFSFGGKNITGLSVQASADSVTDRPIFGAYTPSPERFIGYPAVNAEDICDILTGMTAMVAPILYNPHESGGNRLICQVDQLSDTNAYIRSNLGERYLVGKDITFPDPGSGNFILIGTSATPFRGAFSLGGKNITGLRVNASSTSITDRPIFGNYDASNADFTGYPAVNTEEICDALVDIVPAAVTILYNPHELNGSRLICQANQLSDTRAYIRSNLGGRYLLGKDITFPDPAPGSGNFILIATLVTPFRGAFSLGGKSISNLRVSISDISSTSITDRPIFGNYDASNADFTGYPAVNTQGVCDALVGITPSAAPIPYNPHVSTNNRLICQADQLSDTNAYIRSNLGQRYLLGKDITLSGSFTPIGTITGLFDGGGHTISDLMISSGSVNVGFFGQIASGSVVKNLNFQDPSVSFTGAVAASIGVLAGDSSGRIENVNVTGNTARVSGNTANTMSQAIGGLVGRQTSGTITNSTAMGNVSDGGGGDDPMGGLAGFAQGTITNSTAMGNVSDGGGGYDKMGGLVGRQGGGTIRNSIARGNISNGGGTSDRMGGLVGEQDAGGTITNSTAMGDVSDGGNDDDRMGGLVGEVKGTVRNSIASGDVSMGGSGQDFMGGLVGDDNSSSIESSLSLGNVSGVIGNFFGGLIGWENGTQTNLYWNTQTSGLMGSVGNGTCSGCTGRTTGGTNGLINATSLTGFNTPTSMPTAGPWDFGTTSQYPGLTFTSGDQTCTLRPVLISGSATGTDAEFEICPDAVNTNSFHPTCRSKPTGCPG